MAKEIRNWIAIRNGEACGSFSDRKKAVSWIKKLLKQTLKDLEKQDKTDEFNYAIEIPEYKIKAVITREDFLGL